MKNKKENIVSFTAVIPLRVRREVIIPPGTTLREMAKAAFILGYEMEFDVKKIKKTGKKIK